MLPSEQSALKNLVLEGFYGINYPISFLEQNSDLYDMIQIELPFIEYSGTGGDAVRFITGKGRVIKVHTNGGWVLL